MDQENSALYTLGSNRRPESGETILSLKANKLLLRQLQNSLKSLEETSSGEDTQESPHIVFLSPTSAKIVVGTAEFFLNFSQLRNVVMLSTQDTFLNQFVPKMIHDKHECL